MYIQRVIDKLTLRRACICLRYLFHRKHFQAKSYQKEGKCKEFPLAEKSQYRQFKRHAVTVNW